MESGKVDLHLDHCTGVDLGAEDCLRVRATLCIVAFLIKERLEVLGKEGEGGGVSYVLSARCVDPPELFRLEARSLTFVTPLLVRILRTLGSGDKDV